MKKRVFLFTLVLFVLLVSVSCKTAPKEAPPKETPPPASPPPVSLPPSVPSVPVVDTRAEEARKRAMDFDSHVYFPSDWEVIEEQYTAAGGSQITDRTLSASIAAAYDDLFKKTVPLYAQAREDEIMFIRNELVSSGFAGAFPKYVNETDAAALKAMEQYEAGNYYEARDTAAAALDEYMALLTGARIMIARQELLDRGLEQDEIGKIDVITLKAINEYEAGNISAAVASAEEALFRYTSFFLIVNR